MDVSQKLLEIGKIRQYKNCWENLLCKLWKFDFHRLFGRGVIVILLIVAGALIGNIENAYCATEVVRIIRAGQTISSISEVAGEDKVSVTLSAPYPNNNLKVGQKIVISGTTNYNGTFTILEVTDQSNFTYSDPNTGRAEEATGVAGGDYSSLSAWGADRQADITDSVGPVTFTGTGLDDCTSGGTFTGFGITHYVVEIDSEGSPDTFKWSDDGGNTWQETLVPITGTTQALNNGVTVTFGATTGHTLGDRWEFYTGRNSIEIAECYNDWADGLDDAPVIDGWTTDDTYYIKIYTPTSERHNGTAGTGFWLKGQTDSWRGSLEISDPYVAVEGLEITSNLTNTYHCIGIDVGSHTGWVKISHCLLHDATVNSPHGIRVANIGTLYAWNNIIYNIDNGSSGTGIRADQDSCDEAYIYNNTISDCYSYGISTYGSVIVAKNNLVQNCGTACFSGAFNSSSDYNASDDSSSTGGANDRTNQTFTFVDETNDNFHLAASDTGAKDAGVDLSSDANLSFSDDIDGEDRTGLDWDIGADEIAVVEATTSGNWSSASIWSTGVVPSSGQEVVIPSGRTVTFDRNDTTPTCQDITIEEGGTLEFDTTTAENRTLIVKGDIVVNGTLKMRSNPDSNYYSAIKFDCDTNAQYGLIVTATGLLDVQGTSKSDQDVYITALTQDGSHNGYIKLQDGSETFIKYADISYMGADESGKGGISISVNGYGSNEGCIIDSSKIHDGYQGISMGSSYCIVINNEIYDFSGYYAIFLGEGSHHNFIIGNHIYKPRQVGGSGYVLGFFYSDYNLILDNEIHTKQDYVTVRLMASSDYNIFKGTVDSKELDWSGVPIIKITAIGKTNNLFGTRTTVNENFKNKYSHEILDMLISINTAIILILFSLYSFLKQTPLFLIVLPFLAYIIFRYIYLVNKGSIIGRKPHLAITDSKILLSMIITSILTLVIIYA